LTSHFSIRLVRDPSDLIALTAVLAAAWGLGVSKDKTNYSLPGRARAGTSRAFRQNQLWGSIALGLAALLVMADAAAPDLGIHCLTVDNQGMVADGGYGARFTSKDGGLTWKDVSPSNASFDYENCSSALKGPAIIDQPDHKMQYRIDPDVSVERSQDGGSTWMKETSLQTLNQREKAYVEKTRSGPLVFSSRPLAAQFDPGSGNLVLAMGYDGVLVRKSDGTWTQEAVGGYVPRTLERDGLGGVLVLVFGEIVLAGITLLLVFSTLSIRVRARKFDWIRLILSILLWIGAALVFPPALTNGSYGGLFVAFVLLAAGVWALGWAIADGFRLKSLALRPAGWAVVAGAVFLLPYLGWGAGWLAEYYTAAVAGLILAAAATCLGWVNLTANSGK
jgi:hypothetical protein